MLYLLDANTLINAHRTWYALNRVPEFWRWILHHAEAGTVKIPTQIYGEVENGNDDLSLWMKDAEHKKILKFHEDASFENVQAVLALYGENLREEELIKIGQDPFLIATALNRDGCCVVTAEVSKPKTQRANRRVPDVCNDCHVSWISPVQFINQLDFTTDWENN